MKKDTGVTLIELMVVLAVFGILVVALGFSFQGWMGGYKIESQTKELYNDLINARIKAIQRNRAHFVVVTANDYSIFEDTNENGTYDPGTDNDMVKFTNPKPLEYPSLWAGTVTMNIRGLVLTDDTIQFNIGTNTPDYDCIVLFATRINIGQWDGANCDVK